LSGECFPWLWAVFNKMRRTTTVETSIDVIPWINLWRVWSWAEWSLLLQRLRHWRPVESGLLRRPSYPPACWNISGRSSGSWVWINRYLEGCNFEGPGDTFCLFSARWDETQSSWVMAMLTNSLKLSALTRFKHSFNLVFSQRRNRSLFLVSVSA
jgi:hypothetical protein